MQGKNLKEEAEEMENLANDSSLAKSEHKKMDIEGIKKIVETEEQNTQPNYIACGLVIGLCLGGGCLGVLLNNVSLGIGIGMGIGLIGGIVMAYKNIEVDDKNEEDSEGISD